MSSDSKAYYISARKKVLSPGDASATELFQVPNAFDVNKYAENYLEPLFNAAVADPPDGYQPTKEYPRPYPSAAKMYEEHMKIRESWKGADEIIPRGVPLSDSLATDQELNPSWCQPAKRDLYRAADKNCIIHTARFDPVFFKEQVKEFKSYASKNQLNHLNASSFSFTVEFIRLTVKQEDELVQCMAEKRDCEIALSQSVGQCGDYPALFSINNGCRTLSFNFGWFEYKRSDTQRITDVRFLYSKLPEEVIEFFESLPLLYSCQALRKARLLRDSLKQLFKVDIDFKVFDIASLAIATGCRLDFPNIFALSMLVDGHPFPYGIHFLDNFWVRDSDVMPQVAKCYLREEFMVLNNAFSTLFGLFLRQNFPDPDIVLSVAEMSQLEFIRFLSEFVGQALVGAGTGSIGKCATRQDMIKKIADHENKFADSLCDLLADNPAAQEGGARYLHGCRSYFVNKQYDVIKRLDLHLFQCKVPNQDVDIERLSYRFLYKREVVFDNSGAPAKDFGLLPNPEFANTVYSLDLEDIVSLERQFDRDLAPALEEWGRLNVPEIERLLNKLRKLSTDMLARFWVPKVRVYEALRGIYHRMTGIYITVVDLDRVIGTKVTNTRKHHEDLEDKRKLELEKAGSDYKPRARREYKLQSMRVDHLNHKLQYSKNRVGMHQRVMENVPGSNNRKNIAMRKKKEERLARKRDECPQLWVGRIESRRLRETNALADRSSNTLPSGSSSRSLDFSSRDLRHRLSSKRNEQDLH